MYDLLDGVKVVEVAAWLFAPSCGTVLADWGAEVVKIDSREPAAATLDERLEMMERFAESVITKL